MTQPKTSKTEDPSQLAGWGIDTALVEPLRRRLALGGPCEVDDLVRKFNLPYRLVKMLAENAALPAEDAVGPKGSAIEQWGPLASIYRIAARLDDCAKGHPLLPAIARAIAEAPKPIQDLDHVAATPETVLRRALLVKQRYYFEGIKILCLGDHDLTAIACGLAMPRASISVCDIDEHLLEHIKATAAAHGLVMSTYYTDLRIRLNQALERSFDLILTDPPYSQKGVALFCARAIEAARANSPTTVLLCYGSSLLRSDLAYEVQEAISDLRCVIEALLPGFNKYEGALAIGAQSDLYVLRPTRRSPPAAAAIQDTSLIYSKGMSATEGKEYMAPGKFREALAQLEPSANEEMIVVGSGWSDKAQAPSKAKAITLRRYFAALDAPPSKSQGHHRPFSGRVAVSLLPGYAHMWAQTIIASNARELILLGGPNLASILFSTDAAASKLYNLFASKYQLQWTLTDRETRSTLIALRRIPIGTESVRIFVYRYIADHWTAKIGNSVREALIAVAGITGRSLAKNAARELIAATGLTAVQDKRLSDLTTAELNSALAIIETLCAAA